MIRKCAFAVVAAVAAMLCAMLISCGGAKSSVDDLKNLREITWDGTELTVTLGVNKDTGCEWNVQIIDDSIIDYSINRKFTLSDAAAAQKKTIGTSAIGFEGKNGGTGTIVLATPKDWDGNIPGYTYTITVLVNDDGTIAHAEGA